jgi:hypothetical protein
MKDVFWPSVLEASLCGQLVHSYRVNVGRAYHGGEHVAEKAAHLMEPGGIKRGRGEAGMPITPLRPPP